MTNAELASLLNDEFDLRGPARLSANVIRQWVAWDLLPKAQVQGRQPNAGPIWNRDHLALRRARRFAELRYYGVRSERALVAQSYLEWAAVSFDRAKPAIIAEFRSAHAKLWRRLSASIPDGRVSEFSSTKVRALRNQGGPLDPTFRGNQFELSSPMMLAALQSAFGASADNDEKAILMAAAIAQIAPSLAGHVDMRQLAEYGLPTALFAPPDEVEFSGIAIIEAADETAFQQARNKLAQFGKVIRLASNGRIAAALPKDAVVLLSKVSELLPQISGGNWRIVAFAQFLMKPNCEFDDLNLQFSRQDLLKMRQLGHVAPPRIEQF